MVWHDRIRNDGGWDGWALSVTWADKGGILTLDHVIKNGAGRVIESERNDYRDMTYDEAIDVILATTETLRHRPLPFS